MSVHNPLHRDFVNLGGAIKTSGGSLQLVKGEIALVNVLEESANGEGAKILSTPAGLSKEIKYLQIRQGVADKGANRSQSNKAMMTVPFSLDSVKNVRVSAPKITEQVVDELYIGYDGINDGSSFKFKSGDAYFRVTLELEGDPIAFRGAKGGVGAAKELVSVNVEIPRCDVSDTCGGCDKCKEVVNAKAIVIEAVERLRRHQLAGGSKVEDFVEITPILKCDVPANNTEIPYDYYCMSVCDTGSEAALAMVRAQYNTAVTRIKREDATSTYQMLLPRTAGAPTAYAQSIASVIKGCENCPSGFTASDSGVLYAVDLEDDGTDQKALVQALPGAVAGSATKMEGSVAGMGFYTVILDDALTDAEITAFLGTNAITSTATLKLVGTLATICKNGTITNVSWTTCGSCNVIQEEYQITLPDTKCGNDRLAELQAAYKGSTVALATSKTHQVSTITLTGTSGTANINIGGTDYLATFATDLATTAKNFDIAHSTALNTAGYEVTTDGAVITIKGTNANMVTAPTITNVTTNLAGTVVAPVAAPIKANCSTGYSIQVVSDMVCEECAEIFKDYYRTEKPESYDGHDWVKVSTDTSTSGNCLTGIKVKAKSFIMNAEMALRDHVNFVETSTRVRISAGYPVEINENMGTRPTSAYPVYYKTRWQPRTHLAGNLKQFEDESRAHFLGINYREDYLGRLLRGEITNFEDNLKQYVHYVITVAESSNSQGFGGRANQDLNYGIFVEVGRHEAIEAMINKLATHAGVKPVKAFA